MRKREFLYELDARLAMLPEEDRAKSIEYYSEIIDDKMEEGISEENAVAYLGNINDIVAQIVSETPLPKLIKTRLKPKDSLKIWEIALFVFGFIVIGIPIIAALFAVAVALYASLWAVALILLVTPIALAGSGILGIIGFFPLIFTANAANAFLTLAAGLISLGLVIPFFYIAKYSCLAVILINKGIILAIKKSFIKKEV